LGLNRINSEKLIGVHLGASPRWPSKAWHEDNLREFISLAKRKGCDILLLGGPDESGRYERFIQDLERKGIKIFRRNTKNSNKEFAALISLCRLVVCSDSLALHIALALDKPVIGLFFCTSPDEIEGYGLLRKLVSPMLKEFFPEKSDLYNEKLVRSISAMQVMNAVEDVLK
jgi:ADP-heptose:LPS heptosyltransferase